MMVRVVEPVQLLSATSKEGCLSSIVDCSLSKSGETEGHFANIRIAGKEPSKAVLNMEHILVLCLGRYFLRGSQLETCCIIFLFALLLRWPRPSVCPNIER